MTFASAANQTFWAKVIKCDHTHMHLLTWSQYSLKIASDSDSNLRWTNFVPPHSAQDYYTDSNRKVHKDALQSYQLLYGRENDTHTVLAFSRNLQTCDDNDKVITVGLTAWHALLHLALNHQWQGFCNSFFEPFFELLDVISANCLLFRGNNSTVFY